MSTSNLARLFESELFDLLPYSLLSLACTLVSLVQRVQSHSDQRCNGAWTYGPLYVIDR
jgi:hypothetical protein